MEPSPSSTTGGAASPFRRPPSRPVSSRVSSPRPSPVAFGPVPDASLAPPVPGAAARVGAATATRPAASTGREMLARRRRSGALWFYWVAGLSLVNSLAVLTGQHWRFIVGLGITQVADGLTMRSGHGMPVVALVDVALIAGFILLGRFALQGRLWAFAVGAAFYALDGLIFLVVRDWVGVAFHAFVVVMTVRGLDAARRLS